MLNQLPILQKTTFYGTRPLENTASCKIPLPRFEGSGNNKTRRASLNGRTPDNLLGQSAEDNMRLFLRALKRQGYIFNFFGTKLNYPDADFVVDIYKPNEKHSLRTLEIEVKETEQALKRRHFKHKRKQKKEVGNASQSITSSQALNASPRRPNQEVLKDLLKILNLNLATEEQQRLLDDLEPFPHKSLNAKLKNATFLHPSAWCRVVGHLNILA